MQKLDKMLYKKFQQMIEFQNWIQDWVLPAKHRISFRSMVYRGLGFP